MAPRRVAGYVLLVGGILAGGLGVAGKVLGLGGTDAPAAGPRPAAGSPEETTSPEPIEPVEEFIRALGDAITNEDADFLFDRLHPVVVDFYGRVACLDHVARFRPGPTTFTVREVRGPGVYEWTTDGVTTPVPDTYTVDVVLASGDEQRRDTVHLGIVGTRLTWFTDCGEPFRDQ